MENTLLMRSSWKTEKNQGICQSPTSISFIIIHQSTAHQSIWLMIRAIISAWAALLYQVTCHCSFYSLQQLGALSVYSRPDRKTSVQPTGSKKINHIKNHELNQLNSHPESMLVNPKVGKNCFFTYSSVCQAINGHRISYFFMECKYNKDNVLPLSLPIFHRGSLCTNTILLKVSLPLSHSVLMSADKDWRSSTFRRPMEFWRDGAKITLRMRCRNRFCRFCSPMFPRNLEKYKISNKLIATYLKRKAVARVSKI